MDTFNKNEKQQNFNTIKGRILEFNDGNKFCSITLNVGHENPRQVNLVVKKQNYDVYRDSYKEGDKVSIKYFLSSHRKELPEGSRWNTMANILDIEKVIA